jgi:hypothetical protein
VYYRQNLTSNDTLRVDGYVTRSLFDLFSDFTFYLSDPVNGHGIQQHDSRLQEGASSQYVHAGKALGISMLLMAGANLGDNSINVDLFHDKDRQIIPPVPRFQARLFPASRGRKRTCTLRTQKRTRSGDRTSSTCTSMPDCASTNSGLI